MNQMKFDQTLPESFLFSCRKCLGKFSGFDLISEVKSQKKWRVCVTKFAFFLSSSWNLKSEVEVKWNSKSGRERSKISRIRCQISHLPEYLTPLTNPYLFDGMPCIWSKCHRLLFYSSGPFVAYWPILSLTLSQRSLPHFTSHALQQHYYRI